MVSVVVAHECGHLVAVWTAALPQVVWGQAVLSVQQASRVLVIRLVLAIDHIHILMLVVVPGLGGFLKALTLLHLHVVLVTQLSDRLLELGNHDRCHQIVGLVFLVARALLHLVLLLLLLLLLLLPLLLLFEHHGGLLLLEHVPLLLLLLVPVLLLLPAFLLLKIPSLELLQSHTILVGHLLLLLQVWLLLLILKVASGVLHLLLAVIQIGGNNANWEQTSV